MSDQVSQSSAPPSAPRVARPSGQPEMAVLLLAILFLGGCGGGDPFQRVPVSGYVSVDGTPLKSGSIRFVPTGDTKGPAAVAMIDEGLYELLPENGPIVGKHRVEIEATNHFGFDLDDERAYANKVQQGEQVTKNPIPVTFNQQSQLVVELSEEGNSDLDFRLTSSGILADSR